MTCSISVCLCACVCVRACACVRRIFRKSEKTETCSRQTEVFLSPPSTCVAIPRRWRDKNKRMEMVPERMQSSLMRRYRRKLCFPAPRPCNLFLPLSFKGIFAKGLAAFSFLYNFQPNCSRARRGKGLAAYFLSNFQAGCSRARCACLTAAPQPHSDALTHPAPTEVPMEQCKGC